MTNEYVHTPGDEVPVEVVADSTDTVAREGQGVALVGENADAVEVELVEAVSDRCIGVLKDDPKDFEDPNITQADYTSGESAGMATLILHEVIVWMEEDDAYNATVGDYVEVGDGGDVEGYTGPTSVGQGGAVANNLGVAGDGTLQNDSAGDIDLDFTQDAFPYGMVFTTIAREWGVGGKVGVIKFGGN